MIAKSSISTGPAIANTSKVTLSLETQPSSSFQPDTVVSYVPSSYKRSICGSVHQVALCLIFIYRVTGGRITACFNDFRP